MYSSKTFHSLKVLIDSKSCLKPSNHAYISCFSIPVNHLYITIFSFASNRKYAIINKQFIHICFYIFSARINIPFSQSYAMVFSTSPSPNSTSMALLNSLDRTIPSFTEFARKILTFSTGAITAV